MPEDPKVKVEKAAFESCPPNTICTCLDWLTTSQIAAGCANGFVAVWDIAKHLAKGPVTTPSSPARTTSTGNPPKNPRPFFYYPLHITYILAVISCSPSHPDLIVTSSMDGHVRLTNIYTPEADHAVCGRSRFGPSCLAWCDPVQCAISGEETNTLRAIALRRFYGSVTFSRNTANVVSLAVGTMHTTTLAGGADGVVEISNPLRRIINNKLPNYQLTWFMHEWSRKAGGVVRITEGFKVDTPRLFRLATAAFHSEGLVPATIHEEKSAITHVAWNPNVLCGGWAAAAMRSGLVRIEDLAI